MPVRYVIDIELLSKEVDENDDEAMALKSREIMNAINCLLENHICTNHYSILGIDQVGVRGKRDLNGKIVTE